MTRLTSAGCASRRRRRLLLNRLDWPINLVASTVKFLPGATRNAPIGSSLRFGYILGTLPTTPVQAIGSRARPGGVVRTVAASYAYDAPPSTGRYKEQTPNLDMNHNTLTTDWQARQSIIMPWMAPPSPDARHVRFEGCHALEAGAQDPLVLGRAAGRVFIPHPPCMTPIPSRVHSHT